MLSSALVRLSGVAAMLGGTLWVIATVVHASRPRGCIGEECAFRPMRETGAFVGTLTLLSVLLLAAGAVGLLALVRSGESFGRVGNAGVLVGAGGAAVLVVATLVQAVFFGGDFPLMPHFVIPGLLAMVVGFVLAGIAILRSGVLPRWVAVLVIAGALGMLGANEQTARVLLMIPFGVVWVAVGYVLWSRPRAPTRRSAARVR